MLSGHPRGPGGKIHRCVGSSSGELSWDPTHDRLMQFCISISIPDWGVGWEGRKHTHTNHTISCESMDVSLPPGIMRDRALAERDFVTFPEIFFFSVLSKRCRAM